MLVIVTLAPGITAPLESFTTPRIVPVGELSKNQAGWQCDQCNNRCYECLKRTQTDTQCPYHIPLLSNCELQIRKQIWQASRPSLPALPGRFTSSHKNESRRQQFQETHLRFEPVGFDDD